MLVGPIERQIEFRETRRRKLDGLPTVQDRLDYLGVQESEVDETPDVATRDAVARGQFAKRSGASRGKLLKPRPPARDRFDQRRIASRFVGQLRHSRQHQFHFDTAALEADGRRNLNSAVAWVLG